MVGFKDVPHFTLNEEINILDMLVNNGICSSKREAREFINSGSIIINDEKVLDENMVINKETAIENKLLVIRRGKKKYYLGIFE